MAVLQNSVSPPVIGTSTPYSNVASAGSARHERSVCQRMAVASVVLAVGLALRVGVGRDLHEIARAALHMVRHGVLERCAPKLGEGNLLLAGQGLVPKAEDLVLEEKLFQPLEHTLRQRPRQIDAPLSRRHHATQRSKIHAAGAGVA